MMVSPTYTTFRKEYMRKKVQKLSFELGVPYKDVIKVLHELAILRELWQIVDFDRFLDDELYDVDSSFDMTGGPPADDLARLR